MFLIRGHHELNDVKVKAFFETDNVEMATQEEIVNLLVLILVHWDQFMIKILEFLQIIMSEI